MTYKSRSAYFSLAFSIFFFVFLSFIFSAEEPSLSSTSPRGTISFGSTGAQADHEEFLRQEAFYEADGTLKVTDTTLEEKGDSFVMDKARYKAVVPAVLNRLSALSYLYEQLKIDLSPQGLFWDHESIAGVETTEGRIITDGSEIEGGEKTPHLAKKGIIYENAYGPGIDLGVLMKNSVLRKIVKIRDAKSLGAIPKNSEYLEIPYALSLPKDTEIWGQFTGSGELSKWDQESEVIA